MPTFHPLGSTRGPRRPRRKSPVSMHRTSCRMRNALLFLSEMTKGKEGGHAGEALTALSGAVCLGNGGQPPSVISITFSRKNSPENASRVLRGPTSWLSPSRHSNGPTELWHLTQCLENLFQLSPELCRALLGLQAQFSLPLLPGKKVVLEAREPAQ